MRTIYSLNHIQKVICESLALGSSSPSLALAGTLFQPLILLIWIISLWNVPGNPHPASSHAHHHAGRRGCQSTIISSCFLLKRVAPFLIQNKTKSSSRALWDLLTLCYLMGIKSSFFTALYHAGSPFLPNSSAIAFSSSNSFVPDVPGLLRTQLFHRCFSLVSPIRDFLGPTESLGVSKCAWVFSRHLWTPF